MRGPPGHPQLLTSLHRLVTDSARVLPYWVEEAGVEGKAAGVEEAGPGRGSKVGGGFRWQSKDGEVEIVRWR